MLYKFVDDTVNVHGHEKSRFLLISVGVELDKDAVCFFAKLY